MLPKEELSTTTGEPVYIIDYGTHDKVDGHIFNNAMLRIGDKLWSGNVVLHEKCSDWEAEIRQKRDCYSNVILHVTLDNDCETLRHHGETINQLTINCPRSLREEFLSAGQKQNCLNCGGSVSRLASIHRHSLLSRLVAERMEEKSALIEKIHTGSNGNWEDTLFRTLCRSFGFGIQNRVFEEWASILDLRALSKHKDNEVQVYAIMFGQAGLLEKESIPYYYRDNALRSGYFNSLANEYRFLKSKFGLKNIDYRLWETGSNNTPHTRIARLAAIYRKGIFTISNIAECDTASQLHSIIDARPEGYWQDHNCFGGVEIARETAIKPKQADILIINTVIPMLYVYGKHRNDLALCSKAEDFLYSMKNEENHIVRQWRTQGMDIGCAADSQALIQLDRSYCRKCDCRNCNFAYHYIKERLAEC